MGCSDCAVRQTIAMQAVYLCTSPAVCYTPQRLVHPASFGAEQLCDTIRHGEELAVTVTRRKAAGYSSSFGAKLCSSCYCTKRCYIWDWFLQVGSSRHQQTGHRGQCGANSLLHLQAGRTSSVSSCQVCQHRSEGDPPMCKPCVNYGI